MKSNTTVLHTTRVVIKMAVTKKGNFKMKSRVYLFLKSGSAHRVNSKGRVFLSKYDIFICGSQRASIIVKRGGIQTKIKRRCLAVSSRWRQWFIKMQNPNEDRAPLFCRSKQGAPLIFKEKRKSAESYITSNAAFLAKTIL